MAYYAAVVSLVQLLKDITRPDYPFLNSIIDKQQIHVSLYKKFNLLQELLDVYSPKDYQEKSNDILQRRITNAAYHVQDIIEFHISYQSLPKDEPRGVKGIFQHSIYSLKRAYRKLQPQRLKGPMLENISEKEYYQEYLEKVHTEVDSIVEELTRVKESCPTQEEVLQLNPSISAEASKVQAPRGRNFMVDVDKHFMTTIKGQLCGESSKLEVISIVGMGGLGKTTLARNIFDDKLVKDHFDCYAWVTVSQDYHLQNILLVILNSLNIVIKELEEVIPEKKVGAEVLKDAIYKHLFGRRYFIIMDDIWDTKVWADIRRIFPDNSDGSRIMITTRLSDVAVHASSSKFINQMQFLSEDQSWTLLRQNVFAEEHWPKELEVTGKLIAINCRGLPLAIVVIAGILSNVKRAPHDWEEIARNVSSTVIDQNDEHLLNILSLSYKHLPHHLKPCFLYLGSFPEDHEIPLSKLVRLWVSEGFLKPIESRSLEEVGEEYFKELVNRNLVLITRKNPSGKFKSCIIHDLLRDLCIQRARYENFLLCLQRKVDFHRDLLRNVRRVYIQTWDEYSLILEYIKKHASHVRSIISPLNDLLLQDHPLQDHPVSVASCCKLLRVLDAESMFNLSFPNKVLKLLHLRYLTLGKGNIPIPPSIFKLQNLQTLIVGVYVSLPSDIWKMPQLRHVMSKWGVTLPPIPYGEIRIIDGVPLLGSLQTLWRVIDFRFTRDTIEMMPSLKKLTVKCLKDEAYEIWEEFGLNNLVHLRQIESLLIIFYGALTSIVTSLPPNFAFPSTLIKLSLNRCQLPWKDMTIVGSLPNLQILKLRLNAFVGEEWEPIEGEFLKLKFLLMLGLDYLKYWRVENTHFPCLEQLHIIECDELKEIPPEIGDISTLQLIEVKSGSNLRSSAFKIQEEQRDQGNEDLEVRFYSSEEDNE